MDFADIEQAGKDLLAAHPGLRHGAKSVYHRASYLLSKEKVKCEGAVERVSLDDGYEYFYGYYDKSPWSADERYMLCMRAECTNKSVAPAEPIDILVLDTCDGYAPRKVGTSRSWSVQQGAMAQWLGPDFNSRVIYNDFRDGAYVSVVVDVETAVERVLPRPVYAVAPDGSFALTLDFSRLHRLRPGYGYSNLPDATDGQLVPEGPCIWKMDLATGEVEGLFGYADFAGFEPRPEMGGAEHKVNHLMINPSGTRFMVLHRWFKAGKKFTRLVTGDCDGGGLFNLSDDDFVSHCYWKSDDEIISFMRRADRGNHYYLFKDGGHEYKLLWPSLKTDGHCSYSPDGSLVVTDTYPNRHRLAYVYLCREDVAEPTKLATVFAPFSYDFDTRCDLHPRWDRKGEKVCFDSVHEGKRRLYVVPVNPERAETDGPVGVERIPRVIHRVWFGGKESSDVVKKCFKTWGDVLGGYEIHTWDESSFDLESAPRYVQDAFKEGKFAFVSDYVRLKALYDEGGVYLDCDVEVKRDLAPFLVHRGFVGVESRYTISTAVIGAEPHAPWVKDLLDEYDGLSFYKEDGSFNTLPNTKRLQSYLVKRYGYEVKDGIQVLGDGLYVYPPEYLSPINCFTGVSHITANTYAIHRFDNSWKSGKEKLKRRMMQVATRVIGEDRRAALVKRSKGGSC